MMIHRHVPHCFWVDAVLIVYYLINHMPSFILDGAIPYNVMYTSAPLFPIPPKIFCYVYYVYDTRPGHTKLDSKSPRFIFLGYSGTQKGYRYYSPTIRRYLYHMMLFLWSLYHTLSPVHLLPLSQSCLL